MSRKHPQKRAKGDERLAADLKSNRAECPGKPQFTRADLSEVGPCCYELSREVRPDMLAPARLYADEALLDAMLQGDTLNQLANVATLPGVTGCVYGMPDMHMGYGFPVGGVAAMELPHGMVSPGGVGFDINCGVRLISLPITREAAGAGVVDLTHELSRTIPSGMGTGGGVELDRSDLNGVLEGGSRFAVERLGLGLPQDLDHTESGGCLPGADAEKVSFRACERGLDQLGTMGSGNHFVEVQVVDQVFDDAAAAAMGLGLGSLCVLIHTGSRGLGHQVCTDTVKLMDARLAAQGIKLPDRQLSCAPASSPEGQDYLAAMACAANFAWANRQAIGHRVRKAVTHLFRKVSGPSVRVVYDVAHNIAKIEEHGGRRVLVHRKGATRAFGPGHPEIPADYRAMGQPVLIPGSMGTCSYVLAGVAGTGELSWASTCHGAGRSLSRTAAKQATTGSDVRRELEAQGIVVRGATGQGLAEEAPLAYKDVDVVVGAVETAGLARKVARLRPLGVIKG